MMRPRLILSSVAVAMSLLAGPALAQDMAPPPVVEVEAGELANLNTVSITELELDEHRGGFLSAQGIIFDFEAVIRSFDEKGLALETFIDMTAEGLVQTQRGSGISQGASFIHQISDGDLRNLIINTDSGRSLRQETDVTLTLPGFADFQGDIELGRLGRTITEDLSTAMRATGF